MLELLYKDEDDVIVKLDDDFYYYGDGNGGMYAWNANVFLRFTFMDAADASDRIPDKVLDFLEKTADDVAEQFAKDKASDDEKLHHPIYTVKPDGEMRRGA